jgi:hypothetical protein
LLPNLNRSIPGTKRSPTQLLSRGQDQRCQPLDVLTLRVDVDKVQSEPDFIAMPDRTKPCLPGSDHGGSNVNLKLIPTIIG